MNKKQRLEVVHGLYTAANMASDPLVGVVWSRIWSAYAHKQRMRDALEAADDLIRIARVARTKLRMVSKGISPL